jgi:hypothetical protein
MKTGSLIFASLLIITTSCFASTDGLKKGQGFLKARKALQEHGWKPVDVHASDGYEFIGVERILRDSKIYEVDSCAIDKALCIFSYKKNGKCLRLLTHGEELTDMKVDSWSNDCP